MNTLYRQNKESIMANIVQEKIDSGAFILDVRTLEEFEDEHFPNAVCIPVNELPGRLGEIPRDRSVIVYCASGSRSAFAARILKSAGYPDVINAGGLYDLPQAV